MDYNFFLFTKLHEVVFKPKTEYDILFNELIILYDEWEQWDIVECPSDLGTYDSILKFLNNYKQSMTNKTMETRVYGVNLDLILDGIEHQRLVDFEVSDSEFIEIAENHGLVWSIKGFEHEYNISDLNQQILIRII